MASKADFTEEEWDLLLEAPPSAGIVIVVADRGGIVRESYSMAKVYGEARKHPGQSQLIDEIVQAKPELDHTRYRSKEELTQAALERLSRAVRLVEEKGGPQEAAEYRDFCLGVAEHVAKAAKEGLLGLTGERVSGAEETALQEVKAALGVA